MSLDINWTVLRQSMEDLNLQQVLNSQFASIERPDFLGPLDVTYIDFGTIPPEMEIVNITDPLQEFYYDDMDSMESSDIEIQWQPMDVQLEVSVRYQGNIQIQISTSLIVNQPTPQFMILPLQLTLTRAHLQATLVLAYTHSKLHFCLGESESILKDISIESAIGDTDKQVLKNVGKIERFIVQQLQSFLQEFLMFPNYHTIYFEEDQEI
jgi:distribution and morphology protein 12